MSCESCSRSTRPGTVRCCAHCAWGDHSHWCDKRVVMQAPTVYADHMTTTTTTKCILNHAPAHCNEAWSCENEATHEWVRPGKSTIPMCVKGGLTRRIGYVRPRS